MRLLVNTQIRPEPHRNSVGQQHPGVRPSQQDRPDKRTGFLGLAHCLGGWVCADVPEPAHLIKESRCSESSRTRTAEAGPLAGCVVTPVWRGLGPAQTGTLPVNAMTGGRTFGQKSKTRTKIRTTYARVPDYKAGSGPRVRERSSRSRRSLGRCVCTHACRLARTCPRNGAHHPMLHGGDRVGGRP